MIAAGIEGGSKRQIESDWDLEDYRRQLNYWAEVAPPPNIGIMLVATVLGVKFEAPSGIGASPEAPALEGPSIADLAAMIPAPIAGGDTSSASIAALKIMNKKGGGDAGE